MLVESTTEEGTDGISGGVEGRDVAGPRRDNGWDGEGVAETGKEIAAISGRYVAEEKERGLLEDDGVGIERVGVVHEVGGVQERTMSSDFERLSGQVDGAAVV